MRHYLLGLGCTFAGAWVTELSGSMLPLALGASLSVMCTVPLVRAVWGRRARARANTRR